MPRSSSADSRSPSSAVVRIRSLSRSSAGPGAPLVLDQVGEIGGELDERLVLALRAGGRDGLRGQFAEGRPVDLGHAEQFADDGERQRVGERLHQVGAAVREHRVEQLVGDLLDARPEGLHPACGELAGDQRAQPGVLRRVGDQQVLADRAPRRGTSRRSSSASLDSRGSASAARASSYPTTSQVTWCASGFGSRTGARGRGARSSAYTGCGSVLNPSPYSPRSITSPMTIPLGPVRICQASPRSPPSPRAPLP